VNAVDADSDRGSPKVAQRNVTNGSPAPHEIADYSLSIDDALAAVNRAQNDP